MNVNYMNTSLNLPAVLFSAEKGHGLTYVIWHKVPTLKGS